MAFDVGLWSIVMFGFWFMARRARREAGAIESGQASIDETAVSTPSLESKDVPALGGQGDALVEPILGVQRKDIEPVR